MGNVVTVFGLSGVGKSWLISRYATVSNVAHVQASQLMREARAALVGHVVTSEDLRRGPVLDNQSLLTDAFAKVLATEVRPIIFDGHCLVDVGDQPIEIPVEVIRKLQPAAIMLVYAPANEIVQRRENDISRSRPTRTADALAAQQDRCTAICANYAERLGLRFEQVRAGDERGFSKFMQRFLFRNDNPSQKAII